MVTDCSYGSMTRQNTKLSGDEHKRELVISQNGAIVTVETDKAILRVNQSKVRRDHDPWHDVPLPRNLEKKTDKEVPLETDDADDHAEEDTFQKEQMLTMWLTLRPSWLRFKGVPSQH